MAVTTTVLNLPDLELDESVGLELAGLFKGDVAFTGWYMAFDYPENHIHVRIELHFLDSEVFSRFGKLLPASQAICAKAFYERAVPYLKSNGGSTTVEIQFDWSPTRARRLNLTCKTRRAPGGSKQDRITHTIDLKLIG